MLVIIIIYYYDYDTHNTGVLCGRVNIQYFHKIVKVWYMPATPSVKVDCITGDMLALSIRIVRKPCPVIKKGVHGITHLFGQLGI